MVDQDDLSALESGFGFVLVTSHSQLQKKGIEISVESGNPLSCEKREIACIATERGNLPQWIG